MDGQMFDIPGWLIWCIAALCIIGACVLIVGIPYLIYFLCHHTHWA